MTQPNDMQSAWHQPGARFDVTFSWRLEANARIWAEFVVEVIELNEAMMRLNARLIESKSIRANLPPDKVDPAIVQQIERLTGSIVKVPYEAAAGMTLHLRYETLTGEHGYFARPDHDD